MKYIDLHTSPTEIHRLLLQKGWLQAPSEKIMNVEKPGEGNMNIVLRVQTDRRSFILKQSRPFVQKYQQIEAPLDRIDVEYQFYQTISNKALNAYVPGILAYDKAEHLIMMEDLGHCQDMVYLYQNKNLDSKDISQLVQILHLIHQAELPANYPKNLALRQLNHQHIFVLPFLEDNGFQLDDIQSGLQDLSLSYKKDEAIKAIVNTIGEQYLSEGNTLIHGDYYPGSWMNQEDKLYVIDPEFSFAGFAAFDLGVMAAHLILATGAENISTSICDQYTAEIDRRLVHQVAGIEIMRRLIGLAQLPLQRSIEEKGQLLKLARKMILS